MASALARRYAAAAFEVARGQDAVDAVGADLERAVELLADPRVETAMTNPRVSTPERAELASRLLESLSAPARNLVRLLVVRGRIQLLGEVVSEYRALAEAASGVRRAVVASAVPLDQATQRRIQAALARRFERGVRIETVHDPDLIGGLVIRMGDLVIDDSVRTHLQQLQAAMA